MCVVCYQQDRQQDRWQDRQQDRDKPKQHRSQIASKLNETRGKKVFHLKISAYIEDKQTVNGKTGAVENEMKLDDVKYKSVLARVERKRRHKKMEANGCKRAIKKSH